MSRPEGPVTALSEEAGTVRLLHPDAGRLVDDGATVTRVATGATWSEGPCFVPAYDEVWWSDIPGSRILAYGVTSGEARIAFTDAEFTNGRTLDTDGRIVQCSHGRRRVERLDPETGATEAIADSWNGVRLNSPNDVVVSRDGTVWFTDPPYGIVQPHEGHPGDEEYADHWVFRVPPGSTTPIPAVMDVERPNGLAFSPDESVLYVSDTSEALDHGTNHHIRAYDVYDGVRVKNGRVFAELRPGVSDGFRVDVHGNVWTSAGDGVHVLSPAGEDLALVTVPETVANVCFAGSTLYIAATTSLYRVSTHVTDAAAR